MSRTLPASLYTTHEAYQSERASIFGKEWMILGRTADLAEARGYIAEEIAGFPVFVAVDEAGIPWAYHNVCPHRGGPIFYPGRGHSDELKCRYHGWCFNYEGSLVDMPTFGDNPDMDSTQLRLRDVSIGHWGGFLWVALAGNLPPLTDALGSLISDTADIPFDRLHHTAHVTRVLDCNWKVYVENYIETYHVPSTHSLLTQHFDMSGAFVHVQDSTYSRLEATTNNGVSMRWFYRYPNTALQVLGSTLAWTQILPQGPNRTLVVMDHYAPEGTDDAPLRSLLDTMLGEDMRICTAVQKNLEAGVFNRGIVSPLHESAITWFTSKVMTAHDIRVDL